MKEKKFISFIITILIIFSLSIYAFATEETIEFPQEETNTNIENSNSDTDNTEKKEEDNTNNSSNKKL